MHDSRKETVTLGSSTVIPPNGITRNFIEGLEDESRVWVVEETRMGNALEQYFNSEEF